MKQLLLRLFILDLDGIPSHTKLFSVLGYLMALVLFPYAVIYGTQAGVELWVVFLVTLVGNRSINKLVEARYGITKPKDGQDA